MSFLKRLFAGRTLVLLSFLTGFSSAVYVTHVYNKAELSDALSDALKQQQSAVLAVVDQRNKLRALDQRYYERQLADTLALKTKVKTITKEIVKYVPSENDGACNYSYGAVGLLNAARQPTGVAGELSKAPAESDSALKATSPYTRREEIEAHVQCAEQYNELAISHDALVGWINEHYK